MVESKPVCGGKRHADIGSPSPQPLLGAIGVLIFLFNTFKEIPILMFWEKYFWDMLEWLNFKPRIRIRF
jgi:hypothetical protein